MIAIDVTPLALGPRRGVARALQYLLQGFAEAPPGEPVAFLAPAPLPADIPTLDGVVHEPARSARAFRRALPRLLAREKADVLYSPWSAFPRVDVPVVAVVHELPFVRLGPIEGRLRTWNHKRWLARNVAECAAIVVPSFATRDDVLKLSACSGGKVHVIPWGFDPTPWEAARTRAGRTWAGGAAAALMSGLGGRAWNDRKKGLDLALLAMQLGSVDVELTLVGSVSASVHGTYGVRVIPAAADDEYRALVARAWLFLYPSRSEGFGFPVLEAMAAGVPVVASNAGAIPEVAGGAAILFRSGDDVSLYNEMVDIVHSPDRAAPWVDKGLERARQFPVARCAKQVAEVLRRVRGIS